MRNASAYGCDDFPVHRRVGDDGARCAGDAGGGPRNGLPCKGGPSLTGVRNIVG